MQPHWLVCFSPVFWFLSFCMDVGTLRLSLFDSHGSVLIWSVLYYSFILLKKSSRISQNPTIYPKISLHAFIMVELNVVPTKETVHCLLFWNLACLLKGALWRAPTTVAASVSHVCWRVDWFDLKATPSLYVQIYCYEFVCFHKIGRTICPLFAHTVEINNSAY